MYFITEKSPVEPKKFPFDFKKFAEEHAATSSSIAKKNAHRRGQSLGHVLSFPSTQPMQPLPQAPFKQNLVQGRRHSVALNGSKDVLKELEKNQKAGTTDVKGHRRSNSRNFESNWRMSK